MKNFFFKLVLLTAAFYLPFILEGTENQNTKKDAFKKSDKVEVSWEGTYYKAKITEIDNSRTNGDIYKISYDGYGSESDEWVAPERIKGSITNVQKTKEADRLKTKIETIWTIIGADSPTWNEIKQKAGKENKPIYLLRTAPNCPPCRRLELNTLSKKDFIDGASEKLFLVKADLNPNLPPEELTKIRRFLDETGVGHHGAIPEAYIINPKNGRVMASARSSSAGRWRDLLQDYKRNDQAQN